MHGGRSNCCDPIHCTDILKGYRSQKAALFQERRKPWLSSEATESLLSLRLMNLKRAIMDRLHYTDPSTAENGSLEKKEKVYPLFQGYSHAVPPSCDTQLFVETYLNSRIGLLVALLTVHHQLLLHARRRSTQQPSCVLK